MAFVGRRFARARLALGETAQLVATDLQVSLSDIVAIERGSVSRAVRFHVYLSYAEHLNIPLKAIFDAAESDINSVNAEGTDGNTQVAGLTWIREEVLLDKVKEAITLLTNHGQRVTWWTVSKLSGMSERRLRKWPRIPIFLEQLWQVAQGRKWFAHQYNEDETLVIVQSTVDLLRAHHQIVRVKDISEFTGIPRHALRRYEQVALLVNEATDREVNRHRRQNALLGMVRDEIARLSQLNSPITMVLISAATGILEKELRSYDQVLELIRSHQQKDAERKEQAEELLDRVLEAKRCLEEEGKPVSRQAISRILGLRLCELLWYQEVDQLLKEVTLSSRVDRQQRAEEILEKVPEIARQLKLEEQSITYTSIASRMGYNSWTVATTPGVRELLCNTETPTRYGLGTYDEAEVVDAVSAAIVGLQANGKRVTMAAISEVSSIYATVLRRHPRVVELLAECEANRKRQRAEYDQELVSQLHAIGHRLGAAGILLTKKLLAQELGVQRSQLYEFPIRAEIDELIRTSNEELHRTRELELLARLKAVESALLTQGVRVSLRTVSKMIGVEKSILLRYPRVAEVLGRHLSTRQALREAQRKQREECETQLIAAVAQLRQQFGSKGEPLSSRMAALELGLSIKQLRTYPRVRLLMQEIEEEHQKQEEVRLVFAVTEAIQLLRSSRSVVTICAIARTVGQSVKRLRRYPSVYAILQQAVEKSRSVQLEEIYYDKVLNVLETLHVRGKKVIRPYLVAQIVGVDLQALRRYPRVLRAIEDMSNRQREEEVVTAIMQSVTTLEERGMPVSKSAIARACGRTRFDNLRCYPRIQAILKSLKASREEEVAERVQHAIEALKKERKKITKAAVAQQSGVSYGRMMDNRQVRVIFQELATEQEEERKQREAQLVEEVLKSIMELQRQGKPPTLTAICGLVGMGVGVLKRIPQVKNVFVILRERQPSRQEREEARLSAVSSAIILLRQQGQLPTQSAIAQLVGCSPRALRSYPRVHELLRQSKASKPGTVE
jgi:transcriptional regulator with XRE-family HTH domain